MPHIYTYTHTIPHPAPPISIHIIHTIPPPPPYLPLPLHYTPTPPHPPRYHSLFAKTFSSERRSVLSFVFSLLSEKGCSSGVKDSCMLIVDNLLTKQFDPVEDDCVMLPVGDTDVPLTVTDGT